MDKNQRFRNLSMGFIVPLLFCTAFLVGEILCFGFDSATSCTPNGKTSRRGRAQLIAAIPCDLSMRGYCHLPGTAYPWHAVRRFVHENHGLIKRMYGDVRHIRILRDEIQNNEIDIEDMAETAARYSRDGARRSSKYLQNSDTTAESYGNLRNNEVLMEPYFRPLAAATAASSSAATPTATATATNTIATETSGNPTTSSRPTIATKTPTPTKTTTKTTTATANITLAEAEAEVEATAVAEEESLQQFTKVPEKHQNRTQYSDTIERHRLQQLDDVEITDDDDDNDETNHSDKGSLVSNSVYESPSPSQPPLESVTVVGENIQIVQSPKLASKNFSSTTLAAADDMVTISTTLRSSTTTVREENVLPPSSVIVDKHQSVPGPAPTATTLLSMRINTKRNESESIAAAFLKLATVPPLRPIKNGTLSLVNNSSSSSNHSSSGIFNKNQWLTATLAKTTNTLFSGEPIRNASYTNYTTPMQAINVSSAPKPVIQDPQLHQDTVQKEQDSRINMRGVNACPVKQEVVAPFWANNTRGKVLALLNVYPFEQYVHFEKCTHERKQMYCRDGCRCEQQYHLHRLLAYDVLDECRGIFSDWFRFPSSCICKCYGFLFEFRATSRSPRRSADVHNDDEVAAMQAEGGLDEDEEGEELVNHRHPIDEAEAALKKAIYDHAVDDWYRPRDDIAAAAPAV